MKNKSKTEQEAIEAQATIEWDNLDTPLTSVYFH